MVDRINVGGLYLDLVTLKDACKITEKYIDKNKNINNRNSMMIQAVNTDSVIKANLNKDIATVSNKADLALVDGMPIVWVSKFYKKSLKERVAGPDFFDSFNKIANKKKYSYYFLGATEDVLSKMIERMKNEYPNINISGYYCPPFGKMNDVNQNNEICKNINKFKPDVLWVSFGCPKQEKWIVENKNKIDTSLIMGIGAVFNFYARTIKRAPFFMQKTGLEWLYRLYKEPRRLFRRYIINGPKFFMYVIKNKDKLIS